MPDTKVSALPAVVTPAGTDEFPVNQAGTSKKLTLAQVSTFVVAPSATLAAATTGITNVERVVKNLSIPANTLVVGTTYRYSAFGIVTSTAGNIVTFRVRIGPTTLTGTIAATRGPTATTTAAGDGFQIQGLFTVRSIGTGGTCIAGIFHTSASTQPFTTASTTTSSTATVVVNTTIDNLLELTAVTAATTTTVTFLLCAISVV